jgi:hypothetical protein
MERSAGPAVPPGSRESTRRCRGEQVRQPPLPGSPFSRGGGGMGAVEEGLEARRAHAHAVHRAREHDAGGRLLDDQHGAVALRHVVDGLHGAGERDTCARLDAHALPDARVGRAGRVREHGPRRGRPFRRRRGEHERRRRLARVVLEVVAEHPEEARPALLGVCRRGRRAHQGSPPLAHPDLASCSRGSRRVATVPGCRAGRACQADEGGTGRDLEARTPPRRTPRHAAGLLQGPRCRSPDRRQDLQGGLPPAIPGDAPRRKGTSTWADLPMTRSRPTPPGPRPCGMPGSGRHPVVGISARSTSGATPRGRCRGTRR